MSNEQDHGSAAPLLAPSVVIGQHVVFGAPREARRRGQYVERPKSVTVGPGSIISNFVTLYEGVSIGSDCFLDDGVRIGYDTSVGDRTRIEYAAFVCDRVSVGSDTVVAGFVGDAVQIGSHCIVMGQLVHELSQPGASWGIDEPAPLIHDHSVVGMGSVVVGGIEIGPRSYVAAGATVTRTVPPGYVAVGQNTFIPVSDWSGEKLDRAFLSG